MEEEEQEQEQKQAQEQEQEQAQTSKQGILTTSTKFQSFSITKITIKSEKYENEQFVVTIPFCKIANFLPVKQRLNDLGCPFFFRFNDKVYNVFRSSITFNELEEFVKHKRIKGFGKLKTLQTTPDIRISFFGKKKVTVNKIGKTSRLIKFGGGATRPDLLEYLKKEFDLCDIQSRKDLENVQLYTIWIPPKNFELNFKGKIDTIKPDDTSCSICYEDNSKKWYCSIDCGCSWPMCKTCKNKINHCVICHKKVNYMPITLFTIGIVPSRLNRNPREICKMCKIVYDDYIAMIKDCIDDIEN